MRRRSRRDDSEEARTRVVARHRRVVAVIVIADKVVAERDVAALTEAAAQDGVGVVEAAIQNSNLRRPFMSAHEGQGYYREGAP